MLAGLNLNPGFSSPLASAQRARNRGKYKVSEPVPPLKETWFAWVSGGIITEVLFLVGGVLFTITAVRMTNVLNRKAEAARREVLGDL